MSDGDFISQDSSVDDGFNGEHLVPVGESIRYRKRAQAAEQKLAELDGQLQESNERSNGLSAELEELRQDRRLSESLIAAGVSDVETALLVAKKRIEASDGEMGADSVVESLRKDKGFLFGKVESSVSSMRTLPVRDKTSGVRGVVEKAARNAAGSGSRRDVQEYMRVRRQFTSR
jgi:hypothetical protein